MIKAWVILLVVVWTFEGISRSSIVKITLVSSSILHLLLICLSSQNLRRLCHLDPSEKPLDFFAELVMECSFKASSLALSF